MLLSALALPDYLALCWVSGVGLERRVLSLREGSLAGIMVSGLAFLSPHRADRALACLSDLSLAAPVCAWDALFYALWTASSSSRLFPARQRLSTNL